MAYTRVGRYVPLHREVTGSRPVQMPSCAVPEASCRKATSPDEPNQTDGVQ